MLRRLLPALLLPALIGCAREAAPPRRPSVEALAGDVLVIDGTPIHLANVDVPRGGTAARCWAEAALAQQATQRLGEVAALYSRFDVRRLGTDRDGRELSLVSADGQDLGEELIANGVAVEQSGGRWDWCARPDPSSTAGERLGVVSATESARRGALRIEAAARSALGTGGR